MHLYVIYRSLVRTGWSIITSILKHTDMRCQLSKSMINLVRYVNVLNSFVQRYMIAAPCRLTLSESIYFAGQYRCLETYSWKA